MSLLRRFMVGCGLLLTGAAVAGEETVLNKSVMPDRETLITELQLEAHVEGGYFKRTYQSDQRPKIATEHGERYLLTSIYYLLTEDSPTGQWHMNRSDIIHFWHLGAPVHYFMIHPDGRLETAVLGPDIAAGQQPQLLVSGGVWKASNLPSGDYGLISEAVAPGFDYADMSLGKEDALLEAFPRHEAVIRAYSGD